MFNCCLGQRSLSHVIENFLQDWSPSRAESDRDPGASFLLALMGSLNAFITKHSFVFADCHRCRMIYVCRQKNVQRRDIIFPLTAIANVRTKNLLCPTTMVLKLNFQLCVVVFFKQNIICKQKLPIPSVKKIADWCPQGLRFVLCLLTSSMYGIYLSMRFGVHNIKLMNVTRHLWSENNLELF